MNVLQTWVISETILLSQTERPRSRRPLSWDIRFPSDLNQSLRVLSSPPLPESERHVPSPTLTSLKVLRSEMGVLSSTVLLGSR